MYREYNISSIIVLKLKYNQQYVDFFKIFKKIERFVYQLKFLVYWRIHFVLFVVQLKLIFDLTTNFFARSRSNQLNFVFIKNDIDQMKSFEIKRIINKRQTTRRDSKYFVRWRDYALQYDKWKKFFELNDTKNLIQKYEKIIQIFKSFSNRLKTFFIQSIKRQKFFIVFSSYKFFLKKKFRNDNIETKSFCKFCRFVVIYYRQIDYRQFVFWRHDVENFDIVKVFHKYFLVCRCDFRLVYWCYRQ